MTEEERYYERMNAKLDVQESNGKSLRMIVVVVIGLVAGYVILGMMHGF